MRDERSADEVRDCDVGVVLVSVSAKLRDNNVVSSGLVSVKVRDNDVVSSELVLVKLRDNDVVP